MNHPFLDTSVLTDEDILERLGRANMYLNEQIRLGHTPTIESIRGVIHALDEERVFRMQKFISTELKKRSPKDNEPIELGKLDHGD